MIILPTRGRPHNLARFVHQYYLTGGTLPVHVIFDAADAYRYNAVKTPAHWKRVSVPYGTRLGGIFERVFKKYPDEKYYGMVADDVVPETMHWDTQMAELCQPDKIVWGRDGIQNEKLPVHPFIGGNLLRKLGWWAAPGLSHWFVDNVWKDIADALNCGIYLPDTKMTHRHYINGCVGMDRTYAEQPDPMIDQRRYFAFKAYELPSLLDGIKTIGDKET